MDAEIAKAISSIYEEDEDVVGVVVVDSSGLCLATDGGIPESAAGVIASIAAHGDHLLPANPTQTADVSPVVQIEAESLTITIRKTPLITLGIFKSRHV
ncbi:hypothetical protein GGI01_002545 [Coemansia sp. RSA 376]|nr:hypothetical protein GGI14_001966 [Coemansia sp. S680]KAJ2031787.1 hypothetical protein H4S03_006479 [Coemansia sp. S3946]KAJ2047799.1 hypothetical protein GGI08_006167 [Coemansia sp. S2]KAJ2072555.1 hypothetical protein GGH13_002607 [Coemansia sp. S155-1]KAJ2094573.1 hypothetical protein GGI09_005330 [Coemansia sp. S100]KAJ2250328.1 hypothetical protein GGI13_004048 [Coemansia sp. RSA 455]KAJ2261086.1 hypothetical protein GGI01_002545 [Coemansia sp. RSA 376]KAJ2339347.1 hypothetical prot